jgi:hypothetical protein
MSKQIKNEQGIPVMVVNGEEYRIQHYRVSEPVCKLMCNTYKELKMDYATVMLSSGYYKIGVK